MTRGMRGTVFYKMSGSGNDFVMLDGRHHRAEAWLPADVVAVCDRRMGVGADGLVIITPEGAGRVRMDFWNCDGSRADMCGNAALCSTRLAAYLELAPPGGMQLVTRAGAFPTRVRPEDHQAELNLPDFELPAQVPGVAAEPDGGPPMLTTVGVPHLVVEVSDLERPDLMALGRRLRFSPEAGTGGANVNFVCCGREDGVWRLRTYERGVEGETLACGTGAVAAAVAVASAGRAGLPLGIACRSGRYLTISATLSGALATRVWLAGEGRLVFTGVL